MRGAAVRKPTVIQVCRFCSIIRIYAVFLQSIREKPYPDEERVKGDPARDLAIIHHLCETHLRELQDFAKSQVNMKYFVYE